MEKKERSIISNIWFIVKNTCKWDKVVLVYFLLFTIVTAILPFIDVFVPKFLVDELLGANRVNQLIVILAGYFIVSSVLNYAYSYLESEYFPRFMVIVFKFGELINEKCMKMDFRYTEDAKILNDIETAKRAAFASLEVLQKLFTLVGSAIAFVGYVTIVSTLNVWILLYLLLNVAIIFYLTNKVKKYEYSRKDDISEIGRKGNYIFDTMYNFAYGKDIRIYNLSNWLVDKFQKFKTDEVKIHSDIKYRYFKVAIFELAFLFIREGVVYAYLLYHVLSGALTIGNFLMYSAVIASFTTWMQKILDDISTINAQNLYINDYRNFIEMDLKESQDSYVDVPMDCNYEIEFKNVSFRYPNSERYVFENLSFKIGKGERLALVGINGAGKTTLVKLLTRLYEPTSGEILLNGINIAKFDKLEYYKLFSVVFQDVKLFAFSIAENVACTNVDNIDNDNVLESIAKAGMSDKINSLENGVNTLLFKILDSAGVEFSGGENQKLSLARGLYKDGSIAILDEPTAALDPIAEYNIYQSFNSMIGKKTALFISHRLASTRFCDTIAFFENGKIEEYGTHEQLLSKNGKYAEMFNVQAHYYKEVV